MTKKLLASNEDISYLMDLVIEESQNNPDGKVQLNGKISIENDVVTYEFLQWQKTALKHFIEKYGEDDGTDIFATASKLLGNRLINPVANDL